MIGGFLRHLGISAAKSTIITDPRDLAAALEDVGVESAAGLVVSPQVAVMVSAVSAAVSLLAESIAQLPIHVYERQEKGKDRREGDPLAILLHDRPNTYQTPFEFFELMTLWLLLWGNCYAIVVKTRGAASELIPVHPDRVEVQLDANHRRVYLVSEKDGVQRTYGQESVLHVMDRSFDGLKGRSRLKDGRDTIGLSKAAETWGARLFKNSARPAGLLTSPEKLNAEQMSRLRESWKKAHGGENALGTAVLDAGMEWKPLVMNNRDAQFTESRKFQIAEIARLYRVPPHMVGDLERATFSNIEQQS
ncbi:MAG: phage portal protein, partial [Pseudomonadota bacterium]